METHNDGIIPRLQHVADRVRNQREREKERVKRRERKLLELFGERKLRKTPVNCSAVASVVVINHSVSLTSGR